MAWSEPREIKLSEISHGHSPDKRGERTDKYGRQPILVKRKSRGYVVHDGNDRLYYARQRGDEYIMAEVEEQDDDQPTKKRGFFYWE